jgi:hypothetical protein
MGDRVNDEDIHLPLTELTIASLGSFTPTSANDVFRSDDAPELPPTPEVVTVSNTSPSMDDQPRSLVDHLPSQLTDL